MVRVARLDSSVFLRTSGVKEAAGTAAEEGDHVFSWPVHDVGDGSNAVEQQEEDRGLYYFQNSSFL